MRRSRMLPPAVRWLCLLLLTVQGVLGQLSVGEPDAFLLEDLEASDVTPQPEDTAIDEPLAVVVTEFPPDDATLADLEDAVTLGEAITPETISALEEEEIISVSSDAEFGLKIASDVITDTPAATAMPQLTRRILVSGTLPTTPVVPEASVSFSRPSSLVRFLSDPHPGWLPNYPSLLLQSNSVTRKPTIRFPTGPPPTVVEPTPTPSDAVPAVTPVPSIVPSLTVSKEPVTAYYFDIASAAPTPPPGPLFDPDDLGLSELITPGSRDDLNRPVIELASSIPELQSSAFMQTADPVSVTPTLPVPQTLSVTESPTEGPNVAAGTPMATPTFSLVPTRIPPSTETEVVDNDLANENYSNVTTLVSEVPKDLVPETSGPQPPQSFSDYPDENDDYDYTTTQAMVDTSSPLSPTDPIAVISEDPPVTEETTEVATLISHPEVPPAADEDEEGASKEPPTKDAEEEEVVPEEPFSHTTTPVPPPSVSTTTSTTTTTEKDMTTKIIVPPTSPVPTTPESTITVTFMYPSESMPSLTTSMTFPNGTVIERPLPYVRALVAYSEKEFCQHRNNFRTMLAEWISEHLQEDTSVSPSEIEFFNMHQCGMPKPAPEEHINHLTENLGGSGVEFEEKLNASLDNEEVTNVYFYVTRFGKINPNLTENFPLFPMELEISEELTYLRAKVSQLELVRPDGSTDSAPIAEEASIGTSVIIIIVIVTIVGLTIITALIFFVVVKRKGATNNYYGRRCTPVSMDAYSMDSVSVYHSFRRKSKRRASGRSVKSYLNQAFDDPNGPSRPLNFAKLTHFISDIDGVYEEFATIPVNMPKYDELPAGVEDKNRYANVIPVPETRVLLKGLKDSPNSEYINANYVRGPRNESKYYIATQAPLDDTVADFWRMIWEQETRVVVMLTDFVEKGIDKCADYLPPSETLDCHRLYGDFQVTLKSRDMREKFVVSNVQLKNLENNLVREVAHMWFTGWPASGVPNEETAFISYILDIRRTRKKLRAKGPILVHCSPGTGRSGTFLACDLMMRQFEDQRSVDIPRTVYSIRRDRAGAVQTKEQYAFIYRVINLYASKLTTGNLDSL